MFPRVYARLSDSLSGSSGRGTIRGVHGILVSNLSWSVSGDDSVLRIGIRYGGAPSPSGILEYHIPRSIDIHTMLSFRG